MRQELAKQTHRNHRHGQPGQSMVELLIALMVILVAMTGLLLVFTQALATSSISKERQAAHAISVRTMEKVRALPFTTVADGLNNVTATVAAPSGSVLVKRAYDEDPTRITTTWKTTFLNAGAQEDVVNKNLTGSSRVPFQDPLYPHVQVTKANSTTYTTRTIVSKKFEDPAVYRVTVLVSWKNPKKAGGIETVSTQSFVYSPQGCVSNATHPFAAPCQPFFYSTTTTGIGSIHLTPGDPTATGISGMRDTDFERAQVDLPEAFTTMQIEQITAVTGKSRASGAKLDAPLDPKQNGNTVENGRADDDPGSTPDLQLKTAFASQTESTAQLPLGTIDGATAARRIFADTGASDAGRLALTAAAASAVAGEECFQGDTGDQANWGLACGYSEVKQGGTGSSGTGSIFFRLKEGGHDHQGFVVTTSTAPVKSIASAARYSGTGEPYCTGTSGEGCVHGFAKRVLGPIRLGRLVSNFAAPVGWNSTTQYVSLENYADVTNSEAGVGAGAPTAARAPAVGPASYALKFYDGTNDGTGNYYTTYNSSNWPAAPIDLPAAPVSLTNGTWHLDITSDLTIGGIPTTESTGPALCADICSRKAQVSSPISGDIFYRIWEETAGGPVYWVDMKIGVDLGANYSETQYRKAPSAG
jgi:Tfp pilus assembly protein PilV